VVELSRFNKCFHTAKRSSQSATPAIAQERGEIEENMFPYR